MSVPVELTDDEAIGLMTLLLFKDALTNPWAMLPGHMGTQIANKIGDARRLTRRQVDSEA